MKGSSSTPKHCYRENFTNENDKFFVPCGILLIKTVKGISYAWF